MAIGIHRLPYIGGRKEGPNKFNEELFSDYDRVIREVAQNTTDNPFNKDQTDPIELKIELLKIDSEQIPDKNILVNSYKSVEQSGRFEQGGIIHKRLLSAIKVLESDKISILKFSDFKTTGLYGKWDDETSPIYRFFASIGFSVENSDGGGSRGHGKTAPFSLSQINTCFYSSYSNKSGKDQFSFFGQTDLFFFEEKKKKYAGEIYYCDFDENSEEYKSIDFTSREEASNSIPAWMNNRDEMGTDVYVLGFENDDSWKEEMIKCCIRNFYASIYDERFVINVENERIDKSTITEKLNLFDEFDKSDLTYQFVTTYIKGHSESKKLKLLGDCKVYVFEKEFYGRKIDFMRSRRMKIFQATQNKWASSDYCAVFICDSENGSKILRKMEGSTHTKWDRNQIENGHKYLKEANDFLREVIEKVVGLNDGEEQDLDISDILGHDLGESKGDGVNVEKAKEETARKIPKSISSEIPGGVRRGTVVVSSTGKLKRVRPVKKQKKEKEKEGTKKSSSKKEKVYRVDDFDHLIVRNQQNQCFDLHVINSGSDKIIQDLSFEIPDETGKGLGLKFVTSVKDSNGNSLIRKGENSYGPIKINEGVNLIQVGTSELNVLLMVN